MRCIPARSITMGRGDMISTCDSDASGNCSKNETNRTPSNAGPVCSRARRVLTVAGVTSSPISAQLMKVLLRLRRVWQGKNFVARTLRPSTGALHARSSKVVAARLALKRLPTLVRLHELTIDRMRHRVRNSTSLVLGALPRSGLNCFCR